MLEAAQAFRAGGGSGRNGGQRRRAGLGAGGEFLGEEMVAFTGLRGDRTERRGPLFGGSAQIVTQVRFHLGRSPSWRLEKMRLMP